MMDNLPLQTAPETGKRDIMKDTEYFIMRKKRSSG
jgi:hypothetical protein